MSRELDIVVFGATGFTGRLVAEYLATHADKPRWAIAGRNRDKLAALGFDVPVLVADAQDAVAMTEIALRTKVVCTTVGPYAKYGSALVAACAAAGTHYCDLSGEPQWIRRMIDTHHTLAKDSGARIVNCCGFDAIPSDLGTWALQQAFTASYGRPAHQVTTLFGPMSGTMSGGTVASGVNAAREAEVDREVRRIMANPYGLDPDPRAERPLAPDVKNIGWNKHFKVFTAPFIMAQVNTRIVRRSHALAGFPWGEDFVYHEVMSMPGSPKGLAMAIGMTGALGVIALAMKYPALRERLARRAPQPGEGPSPEQRARGHWKTRYIASAGPNTMTYEAGDAHGDPGYASTAKMLGESALCLANDSLSSDGGVTTPSVAMGQPLLDRLRRAGLYFDVTG